jgi:uncharacterized membrane protein
MVMKTKVLLCCLLIGMGGPGVLPAQDAAPQPDKPNWEELREQLRNMTPEERKAKLSELRSQQVPNPVRPQPGQVTRPGPGEGLERVLAVLTPEQRESMRKLLADSREGMHALEEQLRTARQDAFTATLGTNYDETVVRQKLEAAAQIEVQLNLIRARAVAKLQPPLSAEQIQQLKSPAAPRRVIRGPQGPAKTPAPRPPASLRDENDLPPPAKP